MAGCLETIGLVVVVAFTLKVVYNVAHFLYVVRLGASLGHQLNLKRFGPWAVVTGATDGIGKAYAQKLASLGLNVVLISRTPSRLQDVANEILNECPTVKVRTIAVDFTQGQSIYPKLKKELENLSIGLLVNNVGMSLGGILFADIKSGEQISDVVNCNVMSMVRMTNLLLPGMRRKNRGLILNIGSLLGVGYSPFHALYASTKAFVDKFSRDLAAECQSDGVFVQSVLPGFVATKMPGLKGKPSLGAPTPEAFVEANFRTIGIESRSAPYWFHRILLYVAEMLHFFVPGVGERLSLKYLATRRK